MATPTLSIIAPTFNERDNVARLVELLDAALAGISWEVVFVDDDSKDGTLDRLTELARKDPRVRFVHRIGRRGLSSAAVEGILSTASPYVAVIDADLQHDEKILPKMLAELQTGNTDIVVGSRYVVGGGVGTWANDRVKISQFATTLAKIVVKADFSDPMSGYFMLTREAFNGAVRNLSTQGYKILVDIFASSPTKLRLKEMPYTFRNREHGESKLDAMVTWEYLMLLLDKTIGKYIPVRFVTFALVGGMGTVVHYLVQTLLYQGAFASNAAKFQTSFLIAGVVAMTFNFFANNFLTYRDKRLKGFVPVTLGLLSFYLVSALGLAGGAGVANYVLAEQHTQWYWATAAGILVGAVWNYAASSVFTWRKK